MFPTSGHKNCSNQQTAVIAWSVLEKHTPFSCRIRELVTYFPVSPRESAHFNGMVPTSVHHELYIYFSILQSQQAANQSSQQKGPQTATEGAEVEGHMMDPSFLELLNENMKYMKYMKSYDLGETPRMFVDIL